jgi:amidase
MVPRDQGLRAQIAEKRTRLLTRSAWYAKLNAFFEQYDFLALPTAQVFPFR